MKCGHCNIETAELQPQESGGTGGIRTHDSLIKSQLLYQLSYSPNFAACNESIFPQLFLR